MALIGLARARVAAGDTTGAKAAYDQFLDLWSGADADLPLLAEARRERAALKEGHGPSLAYALISVANAPVLAIGNDVSRGHAPG